MDRLGIDCLDLDGLTCCPEKTMIGNMDRDAWLVTAARNLSVAEDAGVDFVTPCPGCFGTLKGAGCELEADVRARDDVNRRLGRVGRRNRGAARTRHILEIFYDEVGLSKIRELAQWPLAGMRIAVHYGCHLARPSAELAFDHPFTPRKMDELVEALGAVSIPHETKGWCCGGLLSRVADEETGQAMARSKLRDVAQQGADAICLACPSCFMQYDATQLLLQRRGEAHNVPVVYFTELLGLAMGAEPEELGMGSHRVDTAPLVTKWRARQAGLGRVKANWDYALLRRCAECGACASDCAVARSDPGFEPNAIIRQLAEGKVEEVLRAGEFWRCVECYTCRELCFQRYSMLDIFRTAKHLAVEEGLAPPGTAEGIAAFRKAGRLIEGSASQRKRLGLPALRATGGEELLQILRGDAEAEKGH